jgi:hypothetical protein
MNNTQILQWIKKNLASYINEAISSAKSTNSNLLYTEDWLGAITCRETGELIERYIPQGRSVLDMASLMHGDYSQRSHETKPQYHGFGFIQIDIDSFPSFVHSGDWKDPLKCYSMAISVLEGKRKYLQAHFPSLTGETLERAITAAYNSGEGSVSKCLHENIDIDSRTANHNYSKQVFEFREIYRTLS